MNGLILMAVVGNADFETAGTWRLIVPFSGNILIVMQEFSFEVPSFAYGYLNITCFGTH